jgi:hypothetical protein
MLTGILFVAIVVLGLLGLLAIWDAGSDRWRWL